MPRPGTGARLFLAALVIYAACPPFTSYDSYYTVPTALALIHHGTTAVDAWVPSAPPVSYYALECVPPHGPAIPYADAAGCPGGHWYNFYPVAVGVIAAPLVLLIQAATTATGALVAGPVHHIPQPIIAAFLSGDLVGGHALVELCCAALFGALAVWVQYRIASLFLDSRQAVCLTLLFAFGTAEWSIASRNLFQHGLSELLLSIALYIALLARERDSGLIRLAALPLALAFTVRPSNAVSVAAFTLYVAVHCRRWLLQFILAALPIAVLFFSYNLTSRHALLPRYFYAGPERYPALLGLAMHLISPSRGLLVFAPVFVFSIAGMVLAWRKRWLFPLSPYLIAIVVLHTALIASVWEGHCYGPRYFADITHLFTFFLVPVMLYWTHQQVRFRAALAGFFLIAAAWGVFTNARGATSIAANQWSAIPATPDAKARVWDWRDPQFLRGL